jgi:hypothetical protein
MLAQKEKKEKKLSQIGKQNPTVPTCTQGHIYDFSTHLGALEHVPTVQN